VRRWLGALGLVSLGLACVDLFHGTDGVQSACELDASMCIAAGCSSDAAVARGWAEGACAWLGACGEPSGTLAECMLHALGAYDCRATPNRMVRGVSLAFWGCMRGVKSCEAAERCVFPGGVQRCVEGGFSTCGLAGDAGNGNVATRLVCSDAGSLARGENCSAWGQTCALGPASSYGACAGDSRGIGCSGTYCSGTELHDCEPFGSATRNIGVDCANYGGGRCVLSGASVACLANGGRPCATTEEVTCVGQTVSGCPSGVEERVDCSVFFGATAECKPGVAPRAWDIRGACRGRGSCVTESCFGAVATSCSDTASAITVDCAKAGLASCELRAAEGETPHAQCVR
jgi:hypothetical protein